MTEYLNIPVRSFPDKRCFFIPDIKKFSFNGILDFDRDHPKGKIAQRLRDDQQIVSLHYILANNLLSFGLVEKVSFYSGGIDIVCREEVEDILIICGLVREAFESTLQSSKAFVYLESPRK